MDISLLFYLEQTPQSILTSFHTKSRQLADIDKHHAGHRLVKWENLNCVQEVSIYEIQ